MRAIPLLAVAGVLVIQVGAAGAEQPVRPRFEVLAHVNPGGGYSGDVWGHRGYAYLSSHRGRVACPSQGVRVYDLRDLRRPRLVSTFADARSDPSVAGTWSEKTIVKHVATPRFTGDLAVTSFQSCDERGFHGFGLYDVTDPARPRRLALERTEPRGSHEIWLNTSRGRVYVYTAIIFSELTSAPDFDPGSRTARRPGKPDFRIFDVTDPRRPAEIAGWGAWNVLGINPNRGLGPKNSSYGNLVHSVITNRAGTRAFLSYWDLGTVILDLGRPSRPHYLGRTVARSGNDGNAHSAALGLAERLLIETHETRAGVPVLYDVSNPRSPRRRSVFRLPAAVLAAGHRLGGSLDYRGSIDLTDSVHDAKISGRRGFFSWYNQGVVLADVANPSRPRFLARFMPRPALDSDRLLCPDTRCTAVWGVFVTPDYVLASDLNSGLWVLRVRG